jgi:hypothetical protein
VRLGQRESVRLTASARLFIIIKSYRSMYYPEFEELTEDELLALVRRHLPAWRQACDAPDTDAIALHESEFGSSTTELLLFACAIKFAATKGKSVYVACGKGGASPDGVLSSRVTVFRDTAPTSGTPARGKAHHKKVKPSSVRSAHSGR